MIHLKSENNKITRAFRIAVGDLATNILPCNLGLIDGSADAVMAGLDYDFPWTRDAAINSWNGVSLIFPEIAKNTLLSMIEKIDGKLKINLHQYWDAMIWTTGAWHHYLYTGDKDFLKIALEATRNTLEYLEKNEWDEKLCLFGGAAHHADGTSGYPLVYRIGNDGTGSTCIADWPEANPDKVHPVGFGIPMYALSTNCIYYNAYKLIGIMAEELQEKPEEKWEEMAKKIKTAVNQHFWSIEIDNYCYLIDPLGDCDHQECLGLAYSLLFDIADDEQAEKVLKKIKIVPAGIPVGWPDFPRYEKIPGDTYGRHSACVWPPFEAMFASAAAKNGRTDILMHVVDTLSEFACRDLQFVEVYHPMTGEIYGGIQECNGNLEYEWKSCDRQTWSATAFIRLLLLDVFGMNFTSKGIEFKPQIEENISPLFVKNINYRKMNLDIEISGSGNKISEFYISGELQENAFLSADSDGKKKIKIVL
jgi:glycogen debranching enzyme